MIGALSSLEPVLVLDQEAVLALFLFFVPVSSRHIFQTDSFVICYMEEKIDLPAIKNGLKLELEHIPRAHALAL